MIIDKRNEFCDAVAVNTGGAGTYLLGNQIPVAADEDLGHSDLYLVVTVQTAITAGAGGTIQFHLASDDSASVSTSTSSRHISSPAIAVGSGLAAGTVLFCTRLPFNGSVPYEEYLGLLQTTAVAAMTAGKINAFLTTTPQQWKAVAMETGY